jgi:adenylylsulfate kinase
VQRDGGAAFAIWITGLPASGKSSITAALALDLREAGLKLAVLESDVLRKLFPIEPTYDERDRQYFYSSLAFIGQVLTDSGISVIFDATANRRAYRQFARERIARFVEVFVDCPLEVCIARDPKGIYKKAREGQATDVPGLQAVYELPTAADIVIRGDREKPAEAALRIVELLSRKNLI